MSVAAHPDTGELRGNLAEQDPEWLAEALAAIRARQAQFDEWASALEYELRRRLGTHKFAVYGDWEVWKKPSRRLTVTKSVQLPAAVVETPSNSVTATTSKTDVPATESPQPPRLNAEELFR
jgi:hypothetical protein